MEMTNEDLISLFTDEAREYQSLAEKARTRDHTEVFTSFANSTNFYNWIAEQLSTGQNICAIVSKLNFGKAFEVADLLKVRTDNQELTGSFPIEIELILSGYVYEEEAG